MKIWWAIKSKRVPNFWSQKLILEAPTSCVTLDLANQSPILVTISILWSSKVVTASTFFVESRQDEAVKPCKTNDSCLVVRLRAWTSTCNVGEGAKIDSFSRVSPTQLWGYSLAILPSCNLIGFPPMHVFGANILLTFFLLPGPLNHGKMMYIEAWLCVTLRKQMEDIYPTVWFSSYSTCHSADPKINLICIINLGMELLRKVFFGSGRRTGREGVNQLQLSCFPSRGSSQITLKTGSFENKVAVEMQNCDQ